MTTNRDNFHIPDGPVTVAVLDAAIAKIAYVMVTHNRPQFTPILERLENERATLAAQQSGLERARQIMSAVNTRSDLSTQP